MEERAAPSKALKAWFLRLRPWLFAVTVGIVVGLCGFQETDLRALKAELRKHKVQSHVTVVAIDDKTLAALGRWPFPRSVYATLIDRLFAMGADRVYSNANFSLPQTRREDAALAAAIARHPGRVYMGTSVTGSSFRNIDGVSSPANRLYDGANLVNISYQVDRIGQVVSLPYETNIINKRYQGLSSSIYNPINDRDESYNIDASIDINSIPVVSMVDVLDGNANPRLFYNKPVLFGATSETISDMSVLSPYGRISGTIVHALGAETLFQSRPRSFGWVFLYGLTAIASLILFLRLRRSLLISVFASIAAVVVLGYFSIPTNLSVQLVPTLVMLTILILIDSFFQVRARLMNRLNTNSSSGLRNLLALRQFDSRTDAHLIVAHVHNFADAMSSFPASVEKPLIAQIAARFKLGTNGEELFNGDNGVFAWLSSDELNSIGEQLDGLHALFRNPVQVADANVDLVVTFGIDSDAERPIANRIGSALVAAADAAATGTRWREFDKATLADAAWKLSLLSQLDAAIDDGHLWVAYQPKLDLATRRLVGAEALVRWTHPEKGPISPLEFVGAAEQHNRIEKLTLHVLDRAVLAAATINTHGISFGIAVNLSTRLLENRAIVSAVKSTLAAHRLSPERLTLEITETAMLTSETSLDVLAELRAIGVRISIDDYGTGLSTLEYLKKIPASEIKIDKTFVQSILAGGSDLLMVNSTIQLAHSLGHVVVAEGVETDEVLDRISELNCDLAQGYRIGRPMTFQELARRLAAERSRAA